MDDIEIPKELSDFKPKLIGNFTGRQALSLAAAAILAVILYTLLPNKLGDVKIIIIGIAAMPFGLVGWIEIYGIPFEKFIMTSFVSAYLAPRKRKYVIENSFMKLEKEGLKLIEEEKQAKLKQEKEDNKRNKKKKNGGER